MNMSNTFVGQINLFAGSHNPKDWLTCNGQEVKITDYKDLYKVIGNTFGGNGTHTFKLPNIPEVDKIRYVINTSKQLGNIIPTVGTIGEICLFPASAVPNNWIKCDGTQLDIDANVTLYTLIGGKFGHTDKTFALPSLPPPSAHTIYAICNVGHEPWGQGGANDITFQGTISAIQLFPIPKAFNSDTWTKCNGQNLASEKYAILYSQIGTKWGGTDQHFNLPTLQDPAMSISYIICFQGIFPSE